MSFLQFEGHTHHYTYGLFAVCLCIPMFSRLSYRITTSPTCFLKITGIKRYVCANNDYVILAESKENRRTPHRVGGNRKRYQQSTNADQKSIETVFSIPICRQCDDKCQSKTLFLLIFDLRSSIVLAFSIAAYPVWTRRL